MPLLLAAGLFFVLTPRVNADTTATVTSPDGVNLRSGPGTSFAVLVVMPFNASVTITGDAVEDDWLPVTFGSQSGYAKGEYLARQGREAAPAAAAPSPTPIATPTPTPTPMPAPTAARPAAPTPAPAAMPAPAATPAPSGVPAAPPQPLPASGPAADTQTATVIPPDGLNLRTGPATSYGIAITVPGGARVQIVGSPTTDGWYSVVYSGKLGWVDGKYLNFGSMPSATSTPVGPPSPPSRFIWPVASRRISTPFSAGHPGIDIDEFPNGGNPVVATAAGTVTFAGGSVCCSYGLYVIVKHTEGYTSLYSHLQSISVSEGQEIAQGGLVGRSGSTGRSTGAHLHFEIRKDGVAVSPLSLLPGGATSE